MSSVDLMTMNECHSFSLSDLHVEKETRGDGPSGPSLAHISKARS